MTALVFVDLILCLYCGWRCGRYHERVMQHRRTVADARAVRAEEH